MNATDIAKGNAHLGRQKAAASGGSAGMQAYTGAMASMQAAAPSGDFCCWTEFGAMLMADILVVAVGAALIAACVSLSSIGVGVDGNVGLRYLQGVQNLRCIYG